MNLFKVVKHLIKDPKASLIDMFAESYAHSAGIEDEYHEMMSNSKNHTIDAYHIPARLTASSAAPKPQWIIDKKFDFCYGHRVWSQKLNEDYCDVNDTSCKCRFLHGHQGEIRVFAETTELKDGMVVDFKMLGWFKNFIDNYLDHKFIIDVHDPWFSQILNAKPVFEGGVLKLLSATQTLNTKDGRQLDLIPILSPGTDKVVGWIVDVEGMSGPEREFYEGFVIVSFIPTSEHLSEWLFDIASNKMSAINVTVTKVIFSETPTSHAEFALR